MKYYIEYEHPYMTIKEIDDTRYTIKPSVFGKSSRVYLADDIYFLVDELYDTIEDCIEWLGTYSKVVKFPDGTIKQI